ncbi:MAG TPA: tetratricopeptide repeat protein [Halomonas sp.]|nr:tetratricopeptide repeat protein [Halomonas sp.]
MAELRSEEEQLDAIKQWWKQNGTSLIAGVALAAAGVFGWNAWQDWQANQAEAASMRYQQLLSLSGQDELDESARTRASELVAEITDEHGDTLYADLALLIDARLAVGQDDLGAARDALEAVIDTSSRDYLQGLARLRLSRLQVADGDTEAALATLEAGVPEPLAAQQANVRGDAHYAQGQEDAARQAWEEALTLAQEHDQPLYGVELKLDNLGHDEATL